MKRLRRLGNTDLEIAPLVLGGGVFGLDMDEARSFPVLDAFVAHGGTMIDTADIYVSHLPGGNGGESETIIGAWLSQRGHRGKLQISSKVGGPFGEVTTGLSADHIVASVEGSLRRLRTDYLDLYFAHMDDPATPQEEVAEGFERVVKAGKVRHIGASNFTPARFMSSLDIAASRKLQRYCAIQPDYNVLDRSFEKEFQKLCVDRGIGVVSYFALALGYLTGKYRSAADLPNNWRAASIKLYMDGKGPAVLAVLDEIAAARGASLAAISLAWVMAKPGITAPITSATNVKQVEQFMPALDLALSAEELLALDDAGA